jgi:hypothetical protein
VHRIGQDQPVTAWRIIAAQTIDARDRRAHRQQGGPGGARAGRLGRGAVSSVDVQLEALVALLTDALREDG